MYTDVGTFHGQLLINNKKNHKIIIIFFPNSNFTYVPIKTIFYFLENARKRILVADCLFRSNEIERDIFT